MKSLYLRLVVLCLGLGVFGSAPAAFGRLEPRITKFFTGPTRSAEVDVTRFISSSDDAEVTVIGVTQGEHGVVTITPDRRKVRYGGGSGYNGSDTFTYTVSDGVSSSTATVQVYDLGAFKGLYTLAIGGGAGRGHLSITASGHFTGKLVFGRRSHTVRGRFDGEGGAIADTRLGLIGPSIFLDLIPGEPSWVSGTFYPNLYTSYWDSYDINGTQASAGGEHSGSYTVLLPNALNIYEMPSGTGWAKMTVQPSGRITIAGRLGDGAAFSTASQLDVYEQCFIFSAGPGGFSLGGYVRFMEVPRQSDCDGELWWARGRSNGRAYRNGFEGPLSFYGSRFIPPASGESILTLPETNAVDVGLSGGNLFQFQSTTMQVSKTFQAKPSAPISKLAAQYAGTVHRSPTGVFLGRFKHPDIKAARSFSGVFFQKRNSAEGFFRGSTETGVVTVTPQSTAP